MRVPRQSCILLIVVASRCVPASGAGIDAGQGQDSGAPDAGGGDGGAPDAGPVDGGSAFALLLGTDSAGQAHHPPPDWTADAGAWNAVNAVYSPAAGKIVFHVHREDIVGGSTDAGTLTAFGVGEYFVAGPGTGKTDASATSELYTANPDGTHAVCLSCADVVDGQSQVTLYKVAPRTTPTPATALRQTGATLYANQNKDLGTWTPDGAWILAGVEMPRHALTHALGTAEIGYFNDLWAISADGRTWVQLTDYASTWTSMDPVAVTPYACAEPACAPRCQYAGTDAGESASPFGAYSCSAPGAPPPASGIMRPVVTHGLSGDVVGAAKVIWAERVGMSGAYVWAGVLQLAKVDLVMSGGIPALVNYQRNLTPTPVNPGGEGLWSNPGLVSDIGAGYEPWDFSADDSLLGVATDAFHSTSTAAVSYATSAISEAFTDSTAWGWRDTSPSLADTTRYDVSVYSYADNAAAYPVNKYGHWEEPTVFSGVGAAVPFIAFGSSADLTPAWNPSSSAATFGLETWVLRQDRARPAMRLTSLNRPGAHVYVYPTSVDASGTQLYVNVVPAGTNLPGAIYTLPVPSL